MRDDARSDDVTSYWNDYLRGIEPDAGASTRIRRRLDGALGQRHGGAPVRDAAPPTQRAAAAIGLFKSTALALGLAAATLGGAHLGARALTPAELPAVTAPPPPDDRRVDVRAHPATVPPPTPATIDVASATTTVPLVRTSPPPTVTRSGATRPVAPSVAIGATPAPATSTAAAPQPVDALRAEIELMDRARSALARGDDDGVLALLDDHAQRFAQGGMIEERRAWTAIAQCRRGAAQATVLARRFASEFPRSSLLDDVEHACAKHWSTDSARRSE